MIRRLAPLALTAVLLACPSTSGTDAGGAFPIVTSVSPTSGPLTGGTVVTVNGVNFVQGATVKFDDVLGADVAFVDARKLTVTSPAVTTPGVSKVTVTNPDGKSGSLPDAFTFLSVTNRVISEAVLQNPANASDASGGAMVSVAVTASVQVPGVTPGLGQGTGVRAQVGWASSVSTPPVSADFTWSDATYLGDADGSMTGDLARDSYTGTISMPGAAMGQVTYLLAARFSVDNGATWTIADRDGAANGVQSAQLARLTVTKASVDWCKLGGEAIEAPPMVNLRVGAMGPVVYGQVYKQDVTTATGAGSMIKGQLGVGTSGADPATWTWVDATFNRDASSGANDEFQATLPVPAVGSYKFAFRFNHEDGPWTYCDADGLANAGFTEDQAGSLTVTAAGIDRCALQFPSMLDTFQGQASELVYGRVFAQGLTDGPGAGAGVDAELGFGPGADAPTLGSWTWSSMTTFNVDVMGGGDEYQGRLTGPAPGSYAYAWRFRAGGGAWVYCDLDGSENGFQAAQAGALTARALDVEECVVSTANAVQTVMPGASSQPYRVDVTVPTVTPGTGQGLGVDVELAFGAAGADPATFAGWAAATFAMDQGQADTWQGTLTAPGTNGVRDVAFRARVGGGAWRYCDRDGSANGYQAAQAAKLSVQSSAISACRLESVSAFSVMSGGPLTAEVRVVIPGVSGSAGASPNLRVQVGVGPQGTDASTSAAWGWGDGAYASDQAGNEEAWRKTFYPAYTGNRAVAGRATLDDGATWTYCDLNGSDVGGYEVGQQYDVTVTPHADFDFCNLQFPFTTRPDAGALIYGQVYEPGLTPSATAPITAQLGLGVESQDPGVAWRWVTAPYFGTSGNNNEYATTLPADAGVGERYAYRYTVDAGSYCYGDANPGSTNGFSGGGAIGEVVP